MPDLWSFINDEYGVIGRTVSTRNEPNTSIEFHFWLSEGLEIGDQTDENLNHRIPPIEIGNIVAAVNDNIDEVTFGIVSEMRSYSDIDSFIADFLSHNFGDAMIDVPTDISEVIVVTCIVMRNISMKTKPIDRSRVYFPNNQGIQYAYGIIDKEGNTLFNGAPIPIGVFENGDGTIASICIDEDFLLGPDGAHLNVSGISGLATKTSSVEFIIKSLLTHTRKRIATVMFNVKSKDLLYIDQINPSLQNDNWSQEVYQELGIPVSAFEETQFFAPVNPNNPRNETQSLRELETFGFEWDLSMIYRDIPSLFNDMDWDDRMEGVWFTIQEEIENETLLTYTQMLGWIDNQITQANRSNNNWIRGNHIATWNKMRSHLRRFPRSFEGLIATAGSGRDIPWEDLTQGNIFLIDISMLKDRAQRLVFGRAVSELSGRLERQELDLDAVVIFVDELNKFAPSRNVRSPLKSKLIDITARGRGIGLVLFGAEQFASSVDKEIVENSSTFLFGRTESTELRSPNYSTFSDEVKTKLTMLPQGQLLIKFAKFSQPIFINIPFPPCVPGDQYETEKLSEEIDDIPF